MCPEQNRWQLDLEPHQLQQLLQPQQLLQQFVHFSQQLLLQQLDLQPQQLLLRQLLYEPFDQQLLQPEPLDQQQLKLNLQDNSFKEHFRKPQHNYYSFELVGKPQHFYQHHFPYYFRKHQLGKPQLFDDLCNELNRPYRRLLDHRSYDP